MRLSSQQRPASRPAGDFSLAKGAILLSVLVTVLAYVSLWEGYADDAKVMGGIVLVLNFIPAAAALMILGLAMLAGLGIHALMLAWPPLTVALGIPYWLWIDRRSHARFERRVAEEVERRSRAGALCSPDEK